MEDILNQLKHLKENENFLVENDKFKLSKENDNFL